MCIQHHGLDHVEIRIVVKLPFKTGVHSHIVTEPKGVVGGRFFPERPAAVGSRLVYSGVWG